jgi:hypothetical protein
MLTSMKRLPLYDDSVDIACTITSADVPARIELIERMRLALTDIERTQHGLLLSFPNVATTDADVRTFAVDEKRCCAFWGFAVESDGDVLKLVWDGPPDAAPLIDRLLAFFTGDEPASELGSLL